MSFINLNDHTGHSAEYSVKVVKEALLAIETKNVNKVNALLEGLSGNIALKEAISLFSNKLDAMSALDAAKLNNLDQIIEAKANLVEIKVGGKKIKVDIDTVEIDGIDTRDYPDFTDAFFSYAEDHKGKELTDDEIDVLTDEHSDLINELIFDQQLYAGLIVAEGKSINKIQKEWAAVTADMASTVKVWKTAEGETKTQLLDKLKALNIRKKKLEVELDNAVMGKDKNVELSRAFESVVNEYQGDGTNKISDDRLGRLIPKMPKGYHGDNTGIGEYTISTPNGDNIVLTRSKDKKNWFYEPSNVALKILEATNTDILDLVDNIHKVINDLKSDKSKDKKKTAALYNDAKLLINRLHSLVESKLANESTITEAKVNYNFSEDELKRVLKLLGRSASTEVKMIKAFEKAFGRKLTRDEMFESTITEAKFVKDFDNSVLDAKTKEEVLAIYPNAEFFIGKSDHFFGEFDENLFFKAYYTKGQKEFEIKSIYSEKNSNYVHLYNESVVTEAFYRMPMDIIQNELYTANQALTTYYDWLKAGNDSGRGKSLDHIIGLLKKCKDEIKKFNKAEELKGTAYEATVKEPEVTEGLDENKPYFDFLVALRDSGATNMFGAAPYLQDEFGMSKGEARKILAAWIKSFNEAQVVEGAVKRFEYDFKQMVKDIKRGYGWIAPDYVASTWENSSDSIDFELVKGELYKRLIDLNILAYGDENDPKAPGEYVKSLKSLNIEESVAERKLTWESLKESLGL